MDKLSICMYVNTTGQWMERLAEGRLTFSHLCRLRIRWATTTDGRRILRARQEWLLPVLQIRRSMFALRTIWPAQAVCTLRRLDTLISANALQDSRSAPSRHLELDIDIGADAKDWSGIQAAEKLKPVETELRRIEETVNEIVTEMEYLRGREQKLRDTNESTNERVKWFAFGTMGMLVGLGAWQIVYLRAYFR